MGEHRERESPDELSVWTPERVRLGGIAAMVGGAVLAVGHSVEYVLGVDLAVIEYLVPVAWVLLPVGFVAYYASERDWFGRLATAGFVVMTVAMATYFVVEIIGRYTTYDVLALVGIVLAFPAALFGALVFGVAMMRADTAPRLGAWLLVAAPFGPLVTLVVGTLLTHPLVTNAWAGGYLFYGLAWVVLGSHLRLY